MRIKNVSFLMSIMCAINLQANDTVALDEIVVSASGFKQNIKESPASISVISGEDLQKENFTQLQSIVNKVPGVSSIGGFDGPSSRGISIRGMEGSKTLILIDGKRVNSAAASQKGGAGDMNTNFIPPSAAIQRVEVIRGPMSSLYGSDAVGGVINIITKKDFSKFSGNIAVSLTKQDHSGIGDGRQVDFYTNIPIYDKYLALQLWGFKKLRDEDNYKGGYQDSDKEHITAKLWITPNENNSFYILGSYDQHDYFRTIGKSAYMPPTRTNLNAYDHERKSYGVGYLGEFDNFSADISYIYDKTKRTSEFDAIARDANGKKANKPVPATVKNHNFNSKFTAFFDNHILTFGYDYHKQSIKNAFNVAKNRREDIYKAKEFSMYEHALFAEDEWEIIENDLFLTLGARYTYNEYFDNHISPRAYLVYNINDNWTIKGGVATGYKTPDVNQISPESGTIQGGWSIVNFGNKDLEPEKSLTYEVGAYYDNNDNFRTSITFFKNKFEDKIIDTDGSRVNKISAFGTCPPGISASHIKCPGWGTFFNIDGVDVWGIELGLDYDILSNLNLNANYTYNNSEIKTGNPIINTPNGPMSFNETGLGRLDGKSLTATPEHSVSATLTYKPIKNLSLFTTANYESRLEEVNFGGGNRVKENGEDLFTLDLGLNYQVNEILNLSAVVYNVFDEVRYNSDRAKYNNKGRRIDNEYYVFPEEGRRFWLQLSASW